MNAGEVSEMLRLLQQGVGQSSVALQCKCDNLETVYVASLPSGEALVSDRGETFAYLATETDSTYRPMNEIDVTAVAKVCRQAGTVLRYDNPESHPSIECAVSPNEEVATAVARVADSIDRVFEMAMQADHVAP